MVIIDKINLTKNGCKHHVDVVVVVAADLSETYGIHSSVMCNFNDNKRNYENFIENFTCSRYLIIEMQLLACIIFALQYQLQQSIAIKSNMLLVQDYLKFNNIQICVFLSCDDSITDRMKNMIHFQHDDVWINWSVVSKENELLLLNYTNILVRLAAPISVVVNLECDKSMEVLEEISKRKMFHFERSWLVFGKNMEQANTILRNQFINMDAEIYLALPSVDEKYELFGIIKTNNFHSF